MVARFNAKDITFSAKFEKIIIKPIKDGIDLRLEIRDLSLNIGEARISNWFLPGLGTSCFDTKVTLGNKKLIPIRARIGLKLVNGKLQFRDKGIKFHLNPRQYVTSGPSNCMGAFGVTDVMTEFLVRNALASARPVINGAVKVATKVLSSKIGDLLLAQLDKARIPVTIPNILIIPETKIKIGVRVNDLKITKNNMRVVLGVALEKDTDKGMEEGELPVLVKYGTIGIKPAFADKLLAALIPAEGTNPIEITPDFHEMVQEILLTSEFSNFIPDLEQIETDTEELKMFVTFLHPPKIGLEGDTLLAGLKGLQLKLMIKKDGEWMDYFFIKLGVDLSIKGEISDGKIKLFPSISNLDITGDFAAGYTPVDNTFLKDELKDMVELLLGLFTEGDEGLAIDVPFFTLGTRRVGVDNLMIKAPYLFIDLVGMNLAE